MVRCSIRRESVEVMPPNQVPYFLNRWVVRVSDSSLYGYSTTWFGAWRMACECVGWKVPR